MNKKKSISWKAKEFDKNNKGKLWFTVLGVITLGLLFLAWYWHSITMMIFVVLAIFLVIVYSLKEPENQKIVINSIGVYVNDREYRFSDIESFWIFYDPPHTKEISLKQKRLVFPNTYIPLGKTDPSRIRKVLLEHVSEEKQKESIIDNLSRLIGF